MRRAVASALSDCAFADSCVVSRYMNHVSRPPFTTSTNTTSPTKETTYLPKRLLRWNQLLCTASFIGILLLAEQPRGAQEASTAGHRRRRQRCPVRAASATMGLTLSPSRRELPALATTISPSRSPSRISVSLSE